MSVLSHLTSVANQLTRSQGERALVEISISVIKSRLIQYFGSEIVQQIQFGSSTRGTILPRKADSQSDIDYMIVFSNSNDYKPQTYLTKLRKFAEMYYSRSEIYQSSPTIILELNHIKFDLVPAYKNYWNSIYIPSNSNNFSEWIYTDPNAFNKQLTEKNTNCQSLIKPMIRLIKYWNAKNNYVYDSYELETYLVDCYYPFCNNLKDYTFKAVEHLPYGDLPSYKRLLVKKIKESISNINNLEGFNYTSLAEDEVKKIFPALN